MTPRPATNAVRAMIDALDAVSIHIAVIDADGRCASLSLGAEALLAKGTLLTLRTSRLCCSKSGKAVANCPLTGGLIDLDHDLEPCLGCVIGGKLPDAYSERCSISIGSPHDGTLNLRLTPVAAADGSAIDDAAALLVIEPMKTPRSAELLPSIAVVLTVAERDVAKELLSGRRPADIAHRRKVSIGTIRSQIKRIYAKLGVSRLVEFIAKARR